MTHAQIDRMLNQFIAFGLVGLVAVAVLMAWTIYEDAKQPLPSVTAVICSTSPEMCQPASGATP